LDVGRTWRRSLGHSRYQRLNLGYAFENLIRFHDAPIIHSAVGFVATFDVKKRLSPSRIFAAADSPSPVRCHAPSDSSHRCHFNFGVDSFHGFHMHIREVRVFTGPARDATYSLTECSQAQMAGIALDDLQTVPDQGSGSSKWKDIVMPLIHDVLDVTIATVAGIVAVSVFFPVYLVVLLAKALVRRVKPSPTI
jgi:hypothetical protein